MNKEKISISKINQEDFELCFKFDSNTIALWSRGQWENEFKKQGSNLVGLFLSNEIVGLCSFQVVLDEAQINYFSINKNFRRQGYGKYLMNYLIKQCEVLKIKKLLLEVSNNNLIAEKFYNNFAFCTVGIRKNYYVDGSDALLKEKKLLNN